MADMLLEQYRSVFSERVSDSYIYNNIDYMCDIMPEVIFTEEKIMKHINKLNNNSSPGPDGISSLCYKKGGQIILDSLIDIYTQMYNESYSPNNSREVWVVPVWKGSSKLLCVNYRPIALSNQSKCHI